MGGFEWYIILSLLKVGRGRALAASTKASGGVGKPSGETWKVSRWPYVEYAGLAEVDMV